MLTDEVVNNTDVADRAERMRGCIEKACEEKLKKKTGNTVKNKCRNYWWDNGINELRKNVIKARGKVTRAKRKANIAIDVLIKEFKEMRRKLKYKIAKGKRERGRNFVRCYREIPWESHTVWLKQDAGINYCK